MSSSTPTAPRTLTDALLPRERSRAVDAALVVGFSAFVALTAQVALPLPFTPVPITGQTLGVLLTAAVLGPRLGALTMLVYLAEGLLGLPVFALGRSAWSMSSVPGLPVIVGPTAGYLLATPLAAALVGALAARGWDRRISSAVPAMLLGNLVILLLGFAWLAAATWLLKGAVPVAALLGASVYPFIPGDLFKIVIAALALPGGWALVRRLRSRP
jgi:biotin transport system substrate-specific component